MKILQNVLRIVVSIIVTLICLAILRIGFLYSFAQIIEQDFLYFMKFEAITWGVISLVGIIISSIISLINRDCIAATIITLIILFVAMIGWIYPIWFNEIDYTSLQVFIAIEKTLQCVFLFICMSGLQISNLTK